MLIDGDISNFPIRIIVAGTRDYSDYGYFSSFITKELEKYDRKSVVFISGDAKTGADKLIIDYCEEHKLPCKKVPADWDKFGSSAGYIRNKEMSKLATHLIAFWDMKSKGTKHMIDISIEKQLNVKVEEIKLVKDEEKFLFFYGGILSQWYPATFTVKNITFNCAEQFMMFCKAMTFNDRMIANLILASKDPEEQKRFGRDVRNFDEERWKKVRRHVIYLGNLHKFRQNPDLLKYLLSTKGKELVEASPTDKIYGIGLGMNDPLIKDRKNWRGSNLLGKELMRVRDRLDNNFETTAIYPNRVKDKMKVEHELLLPEFGNETTEFYSSKGTMIAKGYLRVVYGDHGPYVEFGTDQIQTRLEPKFKDSVAHDSKYFYEWLVPTDGSNIKVYRQLKTVGFLKNPPEGGFMGNREEGYADYKVGMIYINPYELTIKKE